MSRIRGKDTHPETLIRKSLFARKFRYLLHPRIIPGKPDIYLPKYEAAIFVNGCFWHGHECVLFKWPLTRKQFWKEKISGTIARDIKKRQEIELMGIRVLYIWECALKGTNRIELSEVIDTTVQWLRSGQDFFEIMGTDRQKIEVK